MAAETQLTILLALQENPDAAQDMINPDNVAQSLVNMIHAIKSGTLPGKIIYHIDEADGTAAAQTVAFTQANGDAGDTVTICGVVFTVATTPSADPWDGEFAAETDDDTTGENFATAFNAHPALKGLATAANSSGTVTITMTNKGVHGNLGTLAASDATFAAVGAAAFASGAAGTVQKVLAVDQRSKTLA